MSYKKTITKNIKYYISEKEFNKLKNTGDRIDNPIIGYSLQNLILDEKNYWLFSSYIVNGSGSSAAFFRSENYNNFLFNNKINYAYDDCWYNLDKNANRVFMKIDTIKINNKYYTKFYLRNKKIYNLL